VFVSILQLMGFPASSAATAQPGEKAHYGRAARDNQGINRVHEGVSSQEKGRQSAGAEHAAGADTARRQDVKPQPKGVAKAKKPLAQAKPAAKPAAKKAAAKAPAKKPAAKAKPQAAAKPPAKKAAATKALKSVKPAKPAAKPAAKAIAKVAATAAKAVKAVKDLVKPAKPAVKAAPATKKTSSAASAVSVPAKAAAPAKASSKPVPMAASQPSAQPAAAVAAPVQKVAAPPRAVPASMQAPAPAATAPNAAKASYTPMASQSVLTPPPVVAIKKDPKLANNWKTKPAEELTDAEVLAMPDSEYMNEKQMAFFRLKLQQLKQDILNSAGETTEHLREDTVIVPDPADRATIEEEHALELRTRDRERKLLKKIEQSIARIDAGDYGYCDETGEPIGVGRLLARPTATLSLEAQQRRELKQKMFGD
jgi:DnaK suppressor protein